MDHKPQIKMLIFCGFQFILPYKITESAFKWFIKSKQSFSAEETKSVLF